MRGAGGSNGGVGQFVLGLVMMCGGFYLLLNAIAVRSNFGLGTLLFGGSGLGGFGLTTGMVLIPLIFGIGLIFYNARSIAGWVLALGALVALIFGVLASVSFGFRAMSAFDLIVILVLAVGGLGLFLRSLKAAPAAG